MNKKNCIYIYYKEKEREKENNLELEKYIQEREEQLRDSLGIHFYFYIFQYFTFCFLQGKQAELEESIKSLKYNEMQKKRQNKILQDSLAHTYTDSLRNVLEENLKMLKTLKKNIDEDKERLQIELQDAIKPKENNDMYRLTVTFY